MTSHLGTSADPRFNTALQTVSAAMPSENTPRSLEPCVKTSEPDTLPGCGPTCKFRSIPSRLTDNVGRSKPTRNDELLDVIRKEMLDLSTHLYKPLQRWETRLLRILPGLPRHPLICRLDVVTISQQMNPLPHSSKHHAHKTLTYEALSYTWGNTGPIARISCDGMSIPITQNLADALYHIRQADRERVIWADAVCINQCDDDERAQQVGCMLGIFQSAQRAIAWVGVSSRKDSAMLSFMEDLVHSSLEEPSRAEKHDHECIMGLIRLHRWLAKFFSRRWFSRTWIRQEVYACDEIDVQCGDKVIAMQTLIKAIDVVEQLDVDLSEYDRSCVVTSEMATLRFRHYIHHKTILKGLSGTSWRHAKAESSDQTEVAQLRNAYEAREWLRIILQGKLFSATDPRDKIYGIWKMLQDAIQSDPPQPVIEQIELLISYAKPASIVYQDMMKLLINKARNLEVLSCFFDRGRYTSHVVPTWCLDLRVDYGGFSLTATARGIGLAELQDLDACDCLKLHGAVLGSAGTCVDDDYTHDTFSIPELPELGDMGVYDPEGKRYVDGVPTCRVSDLYRTGYGLYTFEPLTNISANHFGRGSYFMMAPRGSTDGDIIIQAYGAFHPFLLRPSALGGEFYHYGGPVVIMQRKTEEGFEGITSEDFLREESTANVGVADADAATWKRWVMARQPLEERSLGNAQDFVLI